MRNWNHTWALLAAAILANTLTSPARNSELQGQVRVRVPAAASLETDIQGVIDAGRELEQAKRWSEALSHYEKAIRNHPSRADLKHRLLVARSHFDLSRRYKDPSFLNAIKRVTDQQAHSMYAEVLYKVSTHHVHKPHWKQVVGNGTTCFKVALADETFVKRYLPKATRTEIQKFVEKLDQQLSIYRIASIRDSVGVAAQAARLSKEALGLPTAATMMEYACGAINALDSYSAYLSGGQMDDIFSQIEGNFVGLGIELKPNNDVLEVVSVIEGGPADEAGLRAGDTIVAVDRKWTQDVTPDVAADMLRGPEGSEVSITCKNENGTSRELAMKRRRIDVPSVDRLKILDPDSGTAYLRLASFQKTTGQDFAVAMWKLHRLGMKRLIVDVRGNPGGLLTAAVDVANKFISRGTIVSTQGRNSEEDRVHMATVAGTWRVPLIVLIDHDSASASEIFAGAIRDHHRGLIIGEKSYGKGSVQGIFPLNVWKSGVRLTTAKFYSPSGRPISDVGVMPDVAIKKAAKPVAGQLTANTDPTLDAAVQEARRLGR